LERGKCLPRSASEGEEKKAKGFGEKRQLFALLPHEGVTQKTISSLQKEKEEDKEKYP